VGRRYQGFDNITWLIGGDRNPEQALESVNALVAGMRESDHRHLLTAHCAPENSAAEIYGNEGWLDFNSTYFPLTPINSFIHCCCETITVRL